MTRMLVEINCPSTGRHYDFWLSKNLTVDTAIEKLSFEIQHFENNPALFSNTRDLILFKAPKSILDRKTTLLNAGVKSGDTLILI